MDEEHTQTGGLPMGSAITVLASGIVGQRLFEMIEKEEGFLNPPHAPALDHPAYRTLWLRLLDRAMLGGVGFRGGRDGQVTPSEIAPGALRGAFPDFTADKLQVAGILYHSVS